MKNQNIKVAMYSPHFLPYYGGTELATYYLAKELKSFCAVQIYTYNWIPSLKENRRYGFNLSAKLKKREIMEGICIYRYPITKLPIVQDFSVNLIRDLSSSDADIVHFQGLHRLLSRWLLQKALKKKIKILSTHALHEAVRILNEGNNFFVSPFFLNSLMNMDFIIALSQTDLRLLLQLGVPKNRITVIPNGIDPKKFDERRQFVERNEKLKILCVARFAPNKNYESLIYVLSKLRNRLDVEAYFVGNFDNHEYFQKIVNLIKREKLEKTVKVCLSLDDPAVVDCYLSCDVFVLPSSMETFPLVILEAMYAGLPIVSTSVGGIPDIIKDGVNGFLVPPNSPEELYRKCLMLLKNKRLRRTMGTTNKETAEKYTWRKIALCTFGIYKQLIDRILGNSKV